jgi:hypothetical protein
VLLLLKMKGQCKDARSAATLPQLACSAKLLLESEVCSFAYKIR